MKLMNFTCLVVSIFLSVSLAAQAKPKVVLKWAVVHDSGDRSVQPVEEFAKQVEKETNGEVQVQLTRFPRESGKAYAEVIPSIVYGDFDMSQLSTAALSLLSPKFAILDMPFVFRDYEHAGHVLDGPVGKKILSTLNDETGRRLRGLAFTYSGGFRKIYGTKEITKMEDFKGLKLLSPNYIQGQEFWSNVGVEFVGNRWMTNKEVGDSFKKSKIDAEDHELNRVTTLLGNLGDNKLVINETNHSLYLTAIVINEKSFQKLSPKQQEIIARLAQKAAVAEREVSLDNEKNNRKFLPEKGFKIVKTPDSVRKSLEIIAEDFYKGQEAFAELINAVRAEK